MSSKVHIHYSNNIKAFDQVLLLQPCAAAIQWSRRRDELDQQEANLLSHVRELRQKVVNQMNASRSSAESAPPPATNGHNHA